MKSSNIQISGKHRLLNNIIYAFLAQGISLFLSIVMSLVVPKILGVDEYSYWQLFIFYAGYVGFFHFGLNDGIYLRTGGKQYEKLEYSLLGMQYKLSIILQTILAMCIVIGGWLVTKENERQMIILFTGVYLVISNASLYLGYIFQAVNQTKIFSMSVMLDRIVVLASMIVLMSVGVRVFEPYVICYIISKLVALIYCIIKGKEIVFTKRTKILVACKEMWINISIGIKLTIANIASMLILGIGKMIIDMIWGIEAFGKFSLSLSLTNFFLLFISQISMVLFPTLRQLEDRKRREIYEIVRNAMGLLLPLVFVFYVPIKELLELWLPQYREGLKYLALLLPICTFDGKMQLLCNTYFKVLRKEKLLLKNNGIAFMLSLVLSLIGGYVVGDIYFIVVSLVLAIAVRSIISEIYLAHVLKIEVISGILQEALLVIIFMFSAWYLDRELSFMAIVFSYIVYLLINHKKLRMLTSILQRLK